MEEGLINYLFNFEVIRESGDLDSHTWMFRTWLSISSYVWNLIFTNDYSETLLIEIVIIITDIYVILFMIYLPRALYIFLIHLILINRTKVLLLGENILQFSPIVSEIGVIIPF